MDINKQVYTHHTYKHFGGERHALAMFYRQIYIYIIYNINIYHNKQIYIVYYI